MPLLPRPRTLFTSYSDGSRRSAARTSSSEGSSQSESSDGESNDEESRPTRSLPIGPGPRNASKGIVLAGRYFFKVLDEFDADRALIEMLLHVVMIEACAGSTANPLVVLCSSSAVGCSMITVQPPIQSPRRSDFPAQLGCYPRNNHVELADLLLEVGPDIEVRLVVEHVPLEDGPLFRRHGRLYGWALATAPEALVHDGELSYRRLAQGRFAGIRPFPFRRPMKSSQRARAQDDCGGNRKPRSLLRQKASSENDRRADHTSEAWRQRDS